MSLLAPELMQRLATLALSSGRRGTGLQGGSRASPRRGRSQEFADHRPYGPGDDLRFLDWHLYGRLDTLWIKLFEAEEDRVVQVLLDCSASMTGAKLDYARQVAAALAWVALNGSDRVTVAGLSDLVAHHGPARRGRGAAPAVFTALQEVAASGGTDLAAAIEALPRQRGSGVALLFTDFLYADGPDAALKRLQARGHEVHALHVLSPADLRPALHGDVVLVDAETGEELALTVDEATLDRYEATVRAWADEMQATCGRLGVGYSRLLTTEPVETLVLGELRRQGLLTR